VFLKRKQLPSSAKRTVMDDWIAALPRDKAQLFDVVVRRWESFYAMMSVALDDGFSFRARGELVCARRQVTVSADLFTRLAGVLIGSCNAAAARGRQMASVPPVEPLNPSFFRGDTARSAAARSEFLHGVLITSRLRFAQKLKILSETMLLLAGEFNGAAEDISAEITIAPPSSWATLETLHDDFTTCMRENEVVLKCFLRALPADQLEAFRVELDSTPPLELVTPKSRVRAKPSRASA
jgi:hypothetical protein